jgi:23S rRNA pseudouridine1911/1915/1917 synthase
MLPLPIIFEDDTLLVIEKPSGLLVHPAEGHEPDTLLRYLETLGKHPHLIHRLDQLASGLMVVAKNPIAAEHLKAQFKTHTITKEYSILVHSKLPRDEGSVTFSIMRSKHNARMAAVPEGQGRAARSDYIVSGRTARYTLVTVKTFTGRTHQIRAHFFALGYPVVGDPLYQTKRYKDDAPRLFLHAKTLGFQHPVTGKYMEFKSALPIELEQYLREKKIDVTNSQYPISNFQ